MTRLELTLRVSQFSEMAKRLVERHIWSTFGAEELEASDRCRRRVEQGLYHPVYDCVIHVRRDIWGVLT